MLDQLRQTPSNELNSQIMRVVHKQCLNSNIPVRNAQLKLSTAVALPLDIDLPSWDGAAWLHPCSSVPKEPIRFNACFS